LPCELLTIDVSYIPGCWSYRSCGDFCSRRLGRTALVKHTVIIATKDIRKMFFRCVSNYKPFRLSLPHDRIQFQSSSYLTLKRTRVHHSKIMLVISAAQLYSHMYFYLFFLQILQIQLY